MSNTVLPEQLYDTAVGTLEEAYNGLFQTTDNQLGMPDHLRRVAEKFREAGEAVTALEQYAMKAAKEWDDQIRGANSENSSMNGGKRRSARKTRRKTRKGSRK